MTTSHPITSASGHSLLASGPATTTVGLIADASVAAAARHVRGVVVGSAVVRAIEQAGSPAGAVAAVRTLVRDLAAGTAR